MKLDVKWMDVTANLLAQQQPVAFFEKPTPTAEFAVVTSDLLSQPPSFATVKLGDVIRVPVFAYRTPSRALGWIFGLGTQIGMEAVAWLVNHTERAPLAANLVLGHECTDLSPEDGYRCYIGIALQTKA